MSDRTDMTPEDQASAAEYALGLLPDGEREGFLTQLRASADLRAEVRGWEQRFAAIAEDEVADVVPPARVLKGLEMRLFGEAEPSGLMKRLSLWRGLSFASMGVAAVAVSFAVLPVLQTSRPPDGTITIPEGNLLMSHLAPTEGATLGLAAYLEPSGLVQIRRVAGSPTPEREQQLWLIVGDEAPVSLGLLSNEPLTTLQPAPEIVALFRSGAALAISDEPPGGSPTGAPTGSVLALGAMVPL